MSMQIVATLAKHGIHILLISFSLPLLFVFAVNPSLFFRKHGWRHAFTGLSYLIWMVFGFVRLETNFERLPWLNIPNLVYDVILGVLGTVLTLTAAFEFQHKNVKNFASGALDEHATITFSEMVEHSFYQVLNLVQIVYLHVIGRSCHPAAKVALVFLSVTPWLFRDYFPVNKFSDNYDKVDERSTWFIRLLYRVKKYQYVFYKHFVLHGLNISAALYSYNLPDEKSFRLFWLLLNASYVMEFFLQTLVKKKHMSQGTMLNLQKLLMMAASCSAATVLLHVNIYAAFSSLVLNFTHRKHDALNTMVLFVVLLFLEDPLLFSASWWLKT